MARPRRRAIGAWIAFDIALHGYLLMIPSVAYAIYFTSVVADGGGRADLWWSVAVALSLVGAGVLAPWVGALADASGRRRTLMVAATVLCGGATALMATVGRGDVVAGLLLFVLAQIGATLAGSLYNAWLPTLAGARGAARLSGLAWGLSYLGGIACLLLCLPFTRGGFEGEQATTFALAFLVTAAFLVVLGLPAIALLPATAPGGYGVGTPYLRIWATVKTWRRDHEVPRFLLAYYLLNDAIVTVIFFTAVMMKQSFSLPVQEVLLLSVALQLVAIPSTVCFGWLGARWSERGAINLTLLIWLGTLTLMLLAQGRPGAIAIAMAMGLVLGSTQSLLRGLFAALVPPGRESEYFGFHALAGRASSALGPLFFGVVSAASGSQRVAMASLALFFVAGGLVLARVRLPRREAARGSA